MSKWALDDFSVLVSTLLTSFLVIQFDFLENRIMTHPKPFAYCQYIRNLMFMLQGHITTTDALSTLLRIHFNLPRAIPIKVTSEHFR